MPYSTKQFLNILFKGEHVTFKAIKENGRGKASTPLYGKLDPKFVDYHNNSGYGIFYMPNTSGSENTQDKDIKRLNAVFIDIDNDTLPEYFPLEPTAIISRADGLGHHVYWFINPTDDTGTWKTTQELLIRVYQSDAAIKNLARLMRVPGTMNQKAAKAGQIYEIKKLRDVSYDIKEVIAAHVDKKKVLRGVRKWEVVLFKGVTAHDGAHEALVKIAMRMNGLGFSEQDIRTEFTAINKKYLKNEYSEQELNKKAGAFKYARGKKGAELKEEVEKELARQELVKAKMHFWYYIYKGNYFINYQEPHKERNKEAFNAQFSEIAGLANPANYAHLHGLIKHAEQVLYEPGNEKVLLTQDNGTCVNIWRDDRCSPDKTPHKWFIEHLDYLMEPEEREHFLNWLGFAVQNPGIKIRHAILIIGGFGIGKSIMFQLFKRLFGPSNAKAPQNENLSDKYTSWAKHTCFCLINELKQEGNSNFYNAIKPFITEEEIEIREMYRDPYTIRNTMNILAFSNEEVPMRLEPGDRRWYVIKSEAKQRPQDYYVKFYNHCENHAGGVLAFLLARDLNKFYPGETPQSTRAKDFIVDYTRSDLEQWIRAEIELQTGLFEFDIICIRDIRENLPAEFMYNKYITAKGISKILRRLGAKGIDNVIRVNGVPKRYVIIRNFEKYDNFQKTGGIGQLVKDMYTESKEVYN